MQRILGITGGVGMGKSTLGKLLSQRGVAVVDTDVIARQIVEPGQPALGEIVQRFGASVLRPDGTLNRDELGRRVFSDNPARLDLEAILHPRIHAIWIAQVERWRADGTEPDRREQEQEQACSRRRKAADQTPREQEQEQEQEQENGPVERPQPQPAGFRVGRGSRLRQGFRRRQGYGGQDGGRASRACFGAVLIPLLFETNSGGWFDATLCAACSNATQAQRLRDRGWTAEQIQQRLQAQWPIEKKIARCDYVVWTDTGLDVVGAQLDKLLKRPLTK